MQYLVSFALLVALAAWMAGVYNHLYHLRRAVCANWLQWCRSTHLRNVSLEDFVSSLAGFLSQHDDVSERLKSMVTSSEYEISVALEPHWGKARGSMIPGERLLRRTAAEALSAVEESPATRGQVHLQQLCSRVSSALYQQDQYATLFDRAVREYNEALSTPSACILAPVFGFVAANPLGE